MQGFSPKIGNIDPPFAWRRSRATQNQLDSWYTITPLRATPVKKTAIAPFRLVPLGFLLLAASASASAAEVPAVRIVEPRARHMVLRAADQPEQFRYLAFPSVIQVAPDEVWLAAKAGARHATDPGAALEIVRHRLSTAATQRLQRLAPPPPKLYQMGELARFPDGSTGVYIDVQEVGHDNRHYRVGAEYYRFDPGSQRFVGPEPFPIVSGITYGYPFDFFSERGTTWQLSMTFGYQPGRRWSVDALRSDNSGRSWQFVRNLTAEFGDLKLNESALVRHGDGFIVATRGYDSKQRLHRTDGEFRERQAATITGAYPFINSHIGRPRVWIREGHGYLLGRNRTTTVASAPMQLALIRFNPDTLAVTGCAILDNAENERVTDGYYAVPIYSEHAGTTVLHVFTYKGVNGQPCDLLRLDYNWNDVK
jgi:hypothetical protein